MNKRSQFILVLSACLFSLAILWSCDGMKEPPPKPVVVKKKIRAQKPPKAGSTKTGRKVASRPKKARIQPKSDIAASAPPAPAARKPANTRPTVKSSVATPATAKKETPAVSKPSPGSAVTSKQSETPPGGDSKETLAFNPKSDIAVAAKNQKQQTSATPASAKSPPVKATAAKAQSSSDKQRAAAKQKKPQRGKNDQESKATANKNNKAKNNDEPQAPYDPTGKVNPFKPLFKDKPDVPAIKKTRKKRIPRTPLERIALSQLKLVGIIQAQSGNRALVQESSGKGYIIKKGTYIGLNTGKVTEIRKDAVIIEEEVENVLGKVSTRKQTLKLPKPPGE